MLGARDLRDRNAVRLGVAAGSSIPGASSAGVGGGAEFATLAFPVGAVGSERAAIGADVA